MERIYIKKNKFFELCKNLRNKFPNTNIKIFRDKNNTIILKFGKKLDYKKFKEVELLVKSFFPNLKVKILN